MKNPFTITFGKEPTQLVSRIQQVNKLVEDFSEEDPSYQACIISGVRGIGKTVTLTEICGRLEQEEDWVVVHLNAGMDLLQSLASKLYHSQRLLGIFDTASINLSFFGIGVSIETTPPITDIEVAIERMLEVVKKQRKKVLISIDEVVSDDNMKIFSNTFQLLLRKDLPVFLLMTGLYENISDLQNEKNVTFLLRTPKMELEPLNIAMMADCYRKQLNISEKEALEMAELTKGYPFAFQVLGYLCYENHDSYRDEILQFDYYLSEYVYNKLWSELSEKDRLLTIAIKNSDNTTENILRLSGMKKNELSVYRDRLIKKGLVVGKTRGILTFTLPRFENFIELRE
jgi:hypothetical protein